MTLTEPRPDVHLAPLPDPAAGPNGPRPHRHHHVLRALALVVALVVGANVAILVADARADDAGTPSQVAATALALAETAEPAPAPVVEPEPDLDPFEGIAVEPARPALDLDGALPVPEMPPADPYAPTPEVRHGTLEIPSIGLSQTLFEGVTLTSINRGPSHWPGTAMPGELGNVVVAGHRTTYTRPFWDLQAVQPGDELIFTMADGDRYVYLLDEVAVVSPTDVHIIEQTRAHTATLFACHPRGSARQRIVGHFTFSPERSEIQPPPPPPFTTAF